MPGAGRFGSPGAGPLPPLPVGVPRVVGPEAGSCPRGQGVAPTCRAAGCRPPLSRPPGPHTSLGAGWGSRQRRGGGDGLWPTATGCGARTPGLSAPGKGVVVVQNHSTTREAKTMVSAAAGPASSSFARYCCVWQKTHGEAALKCRFLTPPEARGMKRLRAERHLPLPGSGGALGGQRRGAAVVFPPNSRSSPKEEKKKYIYSTDSALNIAASQRCQLLYRSCRREIFCKRNRDGPVRNPAPEVCTAGASGSSVGAGCPVPVPPGCSPRGRQEPSRPPGRPGAGLLPQKQQRRLQGIIAIRHLAGGRHG